MKQTIQNCANKQGEDERMNVKTWKMGSNKGIVHKENENCRKY